MKQVEYKCDLTNYTSKDPSEFVEVDFVSIGYGGKIGGYSVDLKHVKVNRIPQRVLNLIEGGKITILLIDEKPVAFEGGDGFSILSGFCREFFDQLL